MSSFKDVPTDKLQAEFDSTLAQINSMHEKLTPIQDELSRRQNARTFVFNQVIEGHADALRANGVDPALIAEAEAYVASEKERKAALRAERALASVEVSK